MLAIDWYAIAQYEQGMSILALFDRRGRQWHGTDMNNKAMVMTVVA